MNDNMISAEHLRKTMREREAVSMKEIKDHFEKHIVEAARKNLFKTSVPFDQWHYMAADIKKLLVNNGYRCKDNTSQKEGYWMEVYWDIQE